MEGFFLERKTKIKHIITEIVSNYKIPHVAYQFDITLGIK